MSKVVARQRNASAPDKRKPGRPAQIRLWPELIAREALSLMDEQGAEALTMKALARRLEVEAPSLYHHVSGKAEIIEMVRDLIVADISLEAFATLPWDEALRDFAHSYHAAFSAHPNLVPLLMRTPVDSPLAYEMYDRVVASMVAQGWGQEAAVEILLGLELFVLGSVIDLSANGLMWDAQVASKHGAQAMSQALAHVSDHEALSLRAFERLLELYLRQLVLEHPGATAPTTI